MYYRTFLTYFLTLVIADTSGQLQTQSQTSVEWFPPELFGIMPKEKEKMKETYENMNKELKEQNEKLLKQNKVIVGTSEALYFDQHLGVAPQNGGCN